MSRKLTDADYCKAAKRLGCPVASVKAVREVESKGAAFYADGFPIILFERHKFYKNADRTKRDMWQNIHPTICNRSTTPRGGYGSYSDQRVKFNLAFSLDPHAAMMACSWGMFQELGENYDDYGFESVDSFVDLMKSGEAGQLEIFIRSIIKRGLADELRRHKLVDWHSFARNYNGPNYQRFDYHNKLNAAFIKWSKENINCDELTPENIGAKIDSISATAQQPSIPTVKEQEGLPVSSNPLLPINLGADEQDANREQSSSSQNTAANSSPALTNPAADSKNGDPIKQDICKERPSTFVRIGAVVTGAVGTVTTFGINLSTIIQNKLEQITTAQIFYGLLGVALIALAIWLYDRSASRANKLNEQKLQIAANPNLITTELNANKEVK